MSTHDVTGMLYLVRGVRFFVEFTGHTILTDSTSAHVIRPSLLHTFVFLIVIFLINLQFWVAKRPFARTQLLTSNILSNLSIFLLILNYSTCVNVFFTFSFFSDRAFLSSISSSFSFCASFSSFHHC